MLDYINEWPGYNNRTLKIRVAGITMSVPSFAASFLCFFPFSVRAEGPIWMPYSAVGEARDLFHDEERAAEGYTWLWGMSAIACGVWAVYSPVRHGVIGAPQIAAAVGALGLAGASLKSYERHGEFSRPRSILSAAMESAGTEGVPLDRMAVLDTERELEGLRETVSAAATGGMRMGCVVPALLCGVAVFGYSLGEASGRDLAGVCVLSALVIGGPSVINSWNINDKLRRLDSLILRWRESVKQQEETKTWKGK